MASKVATVPAGTLGSHGKPADKPHDAFYIWRVAGIIILGMFIVILDSSIVNVALPHMMAAFGSSLEDIEWVSTGYMLSSAVMMPTTGFLGDRIGRKKVYLFCIAAFTIVSMMCGMSWSTGSLIAFRVLQGVAGGAIQPIGQAIMFDVFPDEKRGLAMGLVGIGMMFAPVLGPTLGGYLVDSMSWRWIFYVNLPVGLMATVLGMAWLKESRTKDVKFDSIGFSLMAATLTTCLVAVSQGNRYGWHSPYIVSLFAIAAVTLGAFLIVVFWRAEPIVNLRLYKYSVYTAGTITGMVVSVGLFGGVFLLPVFLQNVMGFDAITTGLIMAPAGLLSGLTMPISGALINIIPPRVQLTIGMSLMALSMFLQARMTEVTPIWDIIWWSSLRSVGMGMAFPAMNLNALAAIPRRDIGQATGLFNVTRQVAGSFAIAGLTALLTQRIAFHMAQLGAQAHRQIVSGLISSVLPLLLKHGSSLSVAQQQAGAVFGLFASREAVVLAYQDCFYAAGVICLLGILPSLFIERRLMTRPEHGAKEPAMMMAE